MSGKIRKKRIGDVTKKNPSPIQIENSVREAGEKMRSLKTENFPVAAGDKLVGTVKGKFADRKVAGFGHDPRTTRVRESMAQQKFFCFEDQTVQEAKKIMQNNDLQYLSVVDSDLHIIGIVTLKDL